MNKNEKFSIEIGAVILFSFIYSILRYHIFKGIEWHHFPLFITNKAIALSSIILIGLAYYLKLRNNFYPEKSDGDQKRRKYFGLAGFGLAMIHSLMSLALLSPHYFSKFYSLGRMNLIGEFSVLLGVLSFFVFLIPFLTSLPGMIEQLGIERWEKCQQMGYLGLLLVGGHVFVIGIDGWLQPQDWPGYLLPLTLIAFIFSISILILKIVILLISKR